MIRLRRRISGLWRGLLRCQNRCRRRPRRESYLRLDRSPQREPTRDCTITGKLLSWTRRLCPFPFGTTLRPRPFRDQGPPKPPKGHLIVYLGREEEEEKEGRLRAGIGQPSPSTPQSVVVPVVYFNHPLFAELLRESEREYGFNHPGGITLPCPYSDFETVRSRVAAAASAGLCCRRSHAGLKRRWPLRL